MQKEGKAVQGKSFLMNIVLQLRLVSIAFHVFGSSLQFEAKDKTFVRLSEIEDDCHASKSHLYNT